MFQASAPATLMLLGEHGVLRGGHGLLAATHQRIHVTLTPLETADIIIESNLGTYRATLETLTIEKPFTFVLAVIKGFEKHFTQGFHLKITADFSDTIGFGSSAAVTVASQSVLAQMLGLHFSPQDFIAKALEAVLAVQGPGNASGADLAASYCGGIVLYRRAGFVFERLCDDLPLVALYSGSKTPTAEVIKHVNAINPSTDVFEAQNAGVLAACAVLSDLPRLGALLNDAQHYHTLFHTMTPALEACTTRLRAEKTIYGAKISGSGLGDCVIGLGTAAGEGIMPLIVSKDGLLSCTPFCPQN